MLSSIRKLHELELEVARLTGWLRRVADMPEYDQDDAHRLRHMGRQALENKSPKQEGPTQDGVWAVWYPPGEEDDGPMLCRIETIENVTTGRDERLLQWLHSPFGEHPAESYIKTHLRNSVWQQIHIPK